MVQNIEKRTFSSLDFLPQHGLLEKLVGLMIEGVPSQVKGEVGKDLTKIYKQLHSANMEDVRVVIFGGGTGLSNIIGGGSRRPSWAENPFTGLKEVFPKTQSVVCVTDDGGSTGELLKDLPLIALGDIRHVLLSSVQQRRLQKIYDLSIHEANTVAALLGKIFNDRLIVMKDDTPCDLLTIAPVKQLPAQLERYIQGLYDFLLTDKRLKRVLTRSHCLGNLLIVAAIYQELGPDFEFDPTGCEEAIHCAIENALDSVGGHIGVVQHGVLPCTSTPSQLRVRYTNGVEVSGESKMSLINRGYPVASVHVDFCASPKVYSTVVEDIKDADLLIFAPGSLYSSIIPIFKVPGLAEAVRSNKKAMKVLVSNLWVQAGETDRSILDPTRKFLVSDMLRAYEHNIPDGTSGLFNEIVCLRLDDVPASILQRYAVEDKIPIYLDRDVVETMGYKPIECGIYSKEALEEQGFIQHDANMLASAIRALYYGEKYLPEKDPQQLQSYVPPLVCTHDYSLLPAERYRCIEEKIGNITVDCPKHLHVRKQLLKILWKHHDIPLTHLDFFKGVVCIEVEEWRRDQKWDNVFSFYDPEDGYIKIRSDQVAEVKTLETGFLIALGEALLGNYAKTKVLKDVEVDGCRIGRVYHLSLAGEIERNCFFSGAELEQWLSFSHMNLMNGTSDHYTRVVNGTEGFLPPGLFMGLVYAWYIDNRHASQIEYKMSLMKIPQTNLIPEQKKMMGKRKDMIRFFRRVVFRSHRNKRYNETT